MRRGLHVLGTAKVVPDDAPSTPSPGADQYAPYAQAAGQVISSIIQATKQQPPTPPPPPPKEESNTVWYAAGGAAALAIIVALLLRSRG